MEHTELKKGMRVLFNNRRMRVVNWYFKDNYRVEIMEGKWNPFFVNLSRVDRWEGWFKWIIKKLIRWKR